MVLLPSFKTSICIVLHGILLILHHVFVELLILLISHLYYISCPHDLVTIKHILSNILFLFIPFHFSPISRAHQQASTKFNSIYSLKDKPWWPRRCLQASKHLSRVENCLACQETTPMPTTSPPSGTKAFEERSPAG